MSRLVRFHRFGGSDVLTMEDLEISQPDAGQVLVAVHAASVNPVDYKIRSGKYPAVKSDRLPYTPGRDVSGIVEKCGAQATRFKAGDEVFGMVDIHGGGYAERVVVDQNAIAAKPSGLDHVHAAAIPLAGQTAWQGLFRHGRLKKGQSVLIHGGSGGVGHFAIQFAKAIGAHVSTTVSTDNVKFAEGLGADVVARGARAFGGKDRAGRKLTRNETRKAGGNRYGTCTIRNRWHRGRPVGSPA
jgi:NADPH:quinone reductase-like Zn-dependent oxidoreductase